MIKKILYGLKKIFSSNIFKVVLFCIGLLLLEKAGRSIFRPDDSRAYFSQTGFLRQPKNSMDAVVIGSSSTYQFIQPPLAYRNHRMRVATVTGPAFPSVAQKYWIEIVHSRQPNALIILNLNNFAASPNITDITTRNSIDNMPFSWAKLKYAVELIHDYGRSFEETIFPLSLFHSDWEKLPSRKINERNPNFMGSFYSISDVKSGINDYSFGHNEPSAVTIGKSSKQIQVLDDTLRTIDRIGADILFLAVPQADAKRESTLIILADYVSKKGYPVYNMSPEGNQIALDSNKDFYNSHHTNIHGAVKVTEALCQYLLEQYPKRFPQVEDVTWQDASRRYEKILRPHLLDFEIDAAPQNFEIPTIENLSVNVNSEDEIIHLSWDISPNAEGYVIFRKLNGENWDRLGETDGCKFTDDLYVVGATNYYCVVPFRTNESGQIIYGRWDYPGAKVHIKLLAPPLRDAVLQSDRTILLRWDLVDSAVSYKIFRKTDSEDEWSMINRIYSGDQFVDQDVEPGKTYIYTVQGVDGLDIDGFRDEVGLTVTVNP